MKQKQLLIEALRGHKPHAIGRFLRGYREFGLVTWEAAAPNGTPIALHRQTFYDAIELASQFLQTDYATEREFVLTGHKGRCLIYTLPRFQPEFIDGVYARDEGMNAVRLGAIFHRPVFFNPDVPADEMLVYCTGQRVCRLLIRE